MRPFALIATIVDCKYQCSPSLYLFLTLWSLSLPLSFSLPLLQHWASSFFWVPSSWISPWFIKLARHHGFRFFVLPLSNGNWVCWVHVWQWSLSASWQWSSVDGTTDVAVNDPCSCCSWCWWSCNCCKRERLCYMRFSCNHTTLYLHIWFCFFHFHVPWIFCF